MKYIYIIISVLIQLHCFDAMGVVSTSRGKLINISKQEPVPRLDSMNQEVDTTISSLVFNRKGISINGFDKKVSDSQEVFYVTNNTLNHISRIKLYLRYSNMAGELLHEREIIVECELPSKSTRRVSIPSFDRNRSHYYYLSTKPRKSATPFKASFKLLRYDIIVSE